MHVISPYKRTGASEGGLARQLAPKKQQDEVQSSTAGAPVPARSEKASKAVSESDQVNRQQQKVQAGKPAATAHQRGGLLYR